MPKYYDELSHSDVEFDDDSEEDFEEETEPETEIARKRNLKPK